MKGKKVEIFCNDGIVIRGQVEKTNDSELILLDKRYIAGKEKVDKIFLQLDLIHHVKQLGD
jgi:sRNA-binding regulator protein Hfq